MRMKIIPGRNSFYTAEIDLLSQGRACSGYGKNALTTELFCCVICNADIKSAMDCSSMIAVFIAKKGFGPSVGQADALPDQGKICGIGLPTCRNALTPLCT